MSISRTPARRRVCIPGWGEFPGKLSNQFVLVLSQLAMKPQEMSNIWIFVFLNPVCHFVVLSKSKRHRKYNYLQMTRRFVYKSAHADIFTIEANITQFKGGGGVVVTQPFL